MAKRRPPVKLISNEVLDAFRALGSIGGKLRWKNVPEAARTAHAKKAAQARWGGKRKPKATPKPRPT